MSANQQKPQIDFTDAELSYAAMACRVVAYERRRESIDQIGRSVSSSAGYDADALERLAEKFEKMRDS